MKRPLNVAWLKYWLDSACRLGKNKRFYTSVAASVAAGLIVALVVSLSGHVVSKVSPKSRRAEEASPTAQGIPDPHPTASRPSTDIEQERVQDPRPEISMPATEGGRRVAQDVYAVPPRISCRIKDDKPLADKCVTVRCASSSTPGDLESLRGVDEKFLQITRDSSPCFQNVEFLFDNWLKREGLPKAANGTYRIRYDAVDSDNQPASPRVLEVTYVSPIDISNPSVFERPGKGLQFLRGRHLTLMPYSNLPFVFGKLLQPFDFQKALSIRGRFRFVQQQASNPAGLDLALCDARGERVAFIFPDGAPDYCSLKLASDGMGALTVKQRKRAVPIRAGRDYYFQIDFTRTGNQTFCRLYLGPHLDTLHHEEIFGRACSVDVLPPGNTWLALKLWKKSEVQLDRFEVLECN